MGQGIDKPVRKDRQKYSNVTDVHHYRDFLSPRYFTTWLAIGGLHLVAWIPVRARPPLARLLSPLLYRLARSRRRVAQTNIRLCFSHLDATEQQRLVKDIFVSTILGFIETAHAWCRSTDAVEVEFQGLENLNAARDSGQGVLLASGHFGPLDLIGALAAPQVAYHTVYRVHDNPLFNYFMTRARERYSFGTVARKDLKGMLRVLQRGEILWYAPDQDYGRKASIFAPFFDVSTATIIMTSKLARAGRAVVIPLWAYRRADQRSYVIQFAPPLDIPSGDDTADATTYNAWLEAQIREHPDQYLWLHKRFKTRPPGEPSVY